MRVPAPGRAEVIGSYANGCIAGASALPAEGPGFQVIRLSRERYWGHPDLIDFVEAFGRRIPPATLRLAVTVLLAGATLVITASLALLAITSRSLDVVLFEVTSAFATCGLSTGLSADLPPSGKYVLTALMFAGRTGTITLAAALALRDRRRLIRLPEERPIVG